MSYRLHGYNSNSVIKNLVLEGTSYTGAIVTSAATETISNLTFKRFFIRDDILAGDRSRWAFNVCNLVDCLFEDGLVEDIYWEHNHYPHSPRGSLTYRNCVGRRAGAQDIQIVYRDIESDTPFGWQQTGLHLIEGGMTDHCGLPRGSGRASYAISAFGRQEGGGSTPRMAWDCPLRIKDRRIIHDQIGQPAGWLLNGAVLCEWRPRFELLGGEINYDGLADQNLVHAHMNEEVIVDGTKIHGQRYFNIDGVAAGRTKLIDISNVTGDTLLRIDGVKIGPLNQGYRWSA